MGTCLANEQDKEAVIPVVFGRRLAQSLPRVTGHCPAEIWHVELSEGGAVPRAVKPPLCSGCCSDFPQYVGGEIAYCIQCPQTITLSVGPLFR